MRRDRSPLLASALLGAAALAAAVVLALRLADLLAGIYRFPDVAAAPLLGRALASGQGPIHLPTQSALGPELLDALVAPLPGHRLIWLALGPVLAAAGIALATRVAWRLTGTRALLVLAPCVAAPPVLLWSLLAQNVHVTTWAATPLLAWAVVRLTGDRLGWVAGAVTGVIAGVAFISDPQLLVAGLLPFLLAAGLIRARERRDPRPLIAPVAGLAAGVAASLMVARLLGIEIVNNYAARPGLDAAVRGIGLAARGLVWVGDGGWFGDSIGPANIVGIVFAVVAVVLPVAVAIREWRHLRPGDTLTSGRLAYALFWALSEGGILGSFIVSGSSTEDFQAHYITQTLLAVAALLPLAVPERGARRLAASAGAAIVSVRMTVGVATFTASLFAPPFVSPHLDTLAAFLSDHQLSRGYVDYWDGYNLTWLTDERVQAIPVLQGGDCTGGDPAAICRFGLLSATGWYQPRAGQTFVAYRADGPCLHRPPDLGAPVASYTVSDWTVLVYPDDVAARLVPAADLVCPG